MTRLDLLEYQKTILTAQKEVLENKKGDIYVREQQAIVDTILPFFNQFTPEVEIEVTRGSVYFRMPHPEFTYKKELFNIYLRENWNFDGTENKKSFDGVDLSYYTTSTKGINTWELRRLQLLGAVAEIVLEHQDRILGRVNQAVLPFKDEFAEVFKELQEIGSDIRVLEQMIASVIKEKIELDLKNDGVEFEKGKNIQLKFNYSPNVKAIKLVDLSKSGKKATAVFTFAHGDHTSREENVNVSSIIDQVYGLRNNIVQHTLAE